VPSTHRRKGPLYATARLKLTSPKHGPLNPPVLSLLLTRACGYGSNSALTNSEPRDTFFFGFLPSILDGKAKRFSTEAPPKKSALFFSNLPDWHEIKSWATFELRLQGECSPGGYTRPESEIGGWGPKNGRNFIVFESAPFLFPSERRSDGKTFGVKFFCWSLPFFSNGREQESGNRGLWSPSCALGPSIENGRGQRQSQHCGQPLCAVRCLASRPA